MVMDSRVQHFENILTPTIFCVGEESYEIISKN